MEERRQAQADTYDPFAEVEQACRAAAAEVGGGAAAAAAAPKRSRWDSGAAAAPAVVDSRAAAAAAKAAQSALREAHSLQAQAAASQQQGWKSRWDAPAFAGGVLSPDELRAQGRLAPAKGIGTEGEVVSQELKRQKIAHAADARGTGL